VAEKVLGCLGGNFLYLMYRTIFQFDLNVKNSSVSAQPFKLSTVKISTGTAGK